jgi:hypothetical protein
MQSGPEEGKNGKFGNVIALRARIEFWSSTVPESFSIPAPPLSGIALSAIVLFWM